ncbi:MAG: cofactor-independent phosphoglycerate mutase [Bacillota bacterium]|nr:cofactor-independent phosphoglycerate mutase [Bacillota bacterium]
MKYLVVLTDGAGDRPIPELEGKTPLQVAELKNINEMAKHSEIGTVQTIPEGMSPGSDAANLSVMGFDPKVYHTGRSPLEAVSMGIDMTKTDVAFRCNLVTLSKDEPYLEKTILDHSSGDITSEEAAELIKAVQEQLGTDRISFYPGFSYRHAMIVHNGDTDFTLTPPHDILTQKISGYMPADDDKTGFIRDMMIKSYDILKDHPVNVSRRERGLNTADSIWIWGQGRKPKLPSFTEKYGITGAAISAVDLIKGIGLCAGLESIDVEGATGTLNTNYTGKKDAAVAAFDKGLDFVYVHLEAPDECSHQGDMPGKIKCLELIDEKIVGPMKEYLEACGDDYKILVIPDHPTPLEIRTHSSESVPFVLYDSRKEIFNEENAYNEAAGSKGMYFATGYELADYFFTA